MKKSNKILIYAGVSIVVILIILTGIFRYYTGKVLTKTGTSSGILSIPEPGMETSLFKITDFNRVEANGGWKVRIRQGTAWQVKIDFTKRQSKNLDIRKNGNTLYLGFVPGTTLRKIKAKAYITMPSLAGLNGNGGLSASFTGFTGNNINITFAGGISVKGSKSSFNSLNLNISGGADMDLKDVPVHDADVNMSGAGSIVLTMTGGILKGSISGAGLLKYYGSVSEERIKISGVAKVQHK
ncbi:MAG: hypothetical protein GXP33_05820 [Spirochaetes bacterium]|nr:hypothetical protein [Spirochaetota bacterium]